MGDQCRIEVSACLAASGQHVGCFQLQTTSTVHELCGIVGRALRQMKSGEEWSFRIGVCLDGVRLRECETLARAGVHNGSEVSVVLLPDQSLPKCTQHGKVVFLGAASAGKSAIIRRFMYNHFEDSSQTKTVGVDFQSKVVRIDDGMAIRLQVWDAAGDSRYHSLLPLWLEDALAVVIVYDLTQRKTFLAVSGLLELVADVLGKDAKVFLVGNKADLASIGHRQVSHGEGETTAREARCAIIETSAATGQGISALFLSLAEDLCQCRRTESHIIADAAGSTCTAASESVVPGAREEDRHPEQQLATSSFCRLIAKFATGHFIQQKSEWQQVVVGSLIPS